MSIVRVERYDQGSAVQAPASGAIAQGQLVGVNSVGRLVLADADAAAPIRAVGLTLQSAAALGEELAVVREAQVSNSAWSWTPNAPVFLSGTAGGFTQTAPTGSGNLQQVVGVALSATRIALQINEPLTVANAPLAFAAATAAGVTTAVGALVGLDNAGLLVLADADTSPVVPAIGVALDAVGPGVSCRVAVTGLITGLAGLTPGARLFVGTTAGAITGTQPTTNGHLVQPVGYAISATTAFVNISAPPVRFQTSGSSTVAFI